MTDDVFMAADNCAFPEILGVRMRPLSVWHWWPLRSLESPFFDGGEYGIEDVCKAVMLCSLDSSGYSRIASDPNALAALYGFIAAEYIGLDKEGREDAVKAFVEYLDACTVAPEYWSDDKGDGKADRIRCPVEWHIVVSLLKNRICQTEAEAWDYPMQRAQCWQAVIGEQAGSKAYVDAKDRADMKKLNEVANA